MTTDQAPATDPTPAVAPAPAPASARDGLASLLGEWVTVTSTDGLTAWQGQLVGLVDDPSLLLNLPGGGAICLPQSSAVQRAAPATPAVPAAAPPHGQARLFSELRDSGLLWLINRVVFHPRGLAFAVHADETGAVHGWSLHANTERDPWQFDIPTDSDGHARAEATIAAALTDEEN